MSSHHAGAEPLLPQHQQQQNYGGDDVPPPDDDDAAAGRLGRSGCVMWITVLVLFMLNIVVAASWYAGQQPVIIYSELNFIALAICFKRCEKAQPGSQLRNRLKVAVGLLAIAFALLFSYMVATVAPPAVAVVVCLMAVGAVAGVSYYFSSAN